MDRRIRDEKSRLGRDGEPVAAARRRSVMTWVLLFVAVALVIDGIAGEHGWVANRRDRRQLGQAVQELEAKRRENAELRDLMHRLQEEDPATIEELARRELGLIKAGEKVFTIRDVPKPTR